MFLFLYLCVLVLRTKLSSAFEGLISSPNMNKMCCLQIIDITEIKYIKDLDMLSELNLLRNPIQELPDYRLSILYRIQRLIELDRRKVEVEEKVSPAKIIIER